MNPSSAKDIVLRFVEIINSHEFENFSEVVSADYIQHNPHALSGLEGLKTFFRNELQALPDLKGEIVLMVAEAELIAAKTIVRGTKNGAPTENLIADFWRIKNGKLAEHW